MQEIYAAEDVKPELITQRVKEIKDGGVLAAASLTPQNVERYIGPALEGGLDILIIQGTVVWPSTSRATTSRSTSTRSCATSTSRASSAAAAATRVRCT